MEFEITDKLDDEDYMRRGVYINCDYYDIHIYYVGYCKEDKETNTLDPVNIACRSRFKQFPAFMINIFRGAANYTVGNDPLLISEGESEELIEAIKATDETIVKVNEVIREYFLKYASKESLEELKKPVDYDKLLRVPGLEPFSIPEESE